MQSLSRTTCGERHGRSLFQVIRISLKVPVPTEFNAKESQKHLPKPVLHFKSSERSVYVLRQLNNRAEEKDSKFGTLQCIIVFQIHLNKLTVDYGVLFSICLSFTLRGRVEGSEILSNTIFTICCVLQNR